MPWTTPDTTELRLKFVTLASSDRYTITELCEEFGISRKCGHKWLVRYAQGGAAALADASRAPHSVPLRTSEAIERLVVAERRLHPTWGPKKLRAVLERKHSMEAPPAISTLGEILKRHGMIEARRRRPGAFAVNRSNLTEALRPNHVWATDFKGWFYTEDGERCDPLTVTDLFSRYLIGVQGLPQATQAWTRMAYSNLFRIYGLPEVIRMDNGSPFGSNGPGGLSKLTVWWISLGIDVEFIKPASPQQNGSHERMHGTLKAECCKPASANGVAQQKRFDRWRKQFNEERPHEALGQRVPDEVYYKSAIRLDDGFAVELYGPLEKTHPVSENGHVSWQGRSWHIGDAFAGQRVVFEPREDDRVVGVRFANLLLGEIGGECRWGRIRPVEFSKRQSERRIASKKPECTSQTDEGPPPQTA
jgi:transposase InsO family protein